MDIIFLDVINFGDIYISDKIIINQKMSIGQNVYEIGGIRKD